MCPGPAAYDAPVAYPRARGIDRIPATTVPNGCGLSPCPGARRRGAAHVFPPERPIPARFNPQRARRHAVATTGGNADATPGRFNPQRARRHAVAEKTPPSGPVWGLRGPAASPVSPLPPSWRPLSRPWRPSRASSVCKIPRLRPQSRVCAGHRPPIPRLAFPRHVSLSPSHAYPCPAPGGSIGGSG